MAIKVHSFVGKVGVEGLHQMDQHINDWMKRNKVAPLHIKQSFGSDKHHDGRGAEPILVISIWYEDAGDGPSF